MFAMAVPLRGMGDNLGKEGDFSQFYRAPLGFVQIFGNNFVEQVHDFGQYDRRRRVPGRYGSALTIISKKKASDKRIETFVERFSDLELLKYRVSAASAMIGGL